MSKFWLFLKTNLKLCSKGRKKGEKGAEGPTGGQSAISRKDSLDLVTPMVSTRSGFSSSPAKKSPQKVSKSPESSLDLSSMRSEAH